MIRKLQIVLLTDLLSVADTAVQPGRQSRADEAHATVAEPGEERVAGRNGDGKTSRMEIFQR